jgi:hypothetical protein
VKGRRHLVSLAFAGFAAALMIQASCVSAFGVDLTTHISAVEDMCSCPQLHPLGERAACVSTLDKRFEGAGPVDRQAWLEKYDRECSTCLGVLACLGERPTCVLEGCTIDAECCQVAGTPKNICLVGGSCGIKK